MVLPLCESDDELEYIATLLLKNGEDTAIPITGYFENVVPNLSDCISLKKILNEKNYVSVADSLNVITHKLE